MSAQIDVKKKLVNGGICSSRVILIDAQGNNLGQKEIQEALEIANGESLDLVQVTDGDIPVCRILNFQKEEYSKKKKIKKSKVQKFKEVRFTTTISEHDQQTKIRQICNFLQEGCRVKIAIRSALRKVNEEAVRKNLENFIANIRKQINVPYKTEGNPNISNSEYSIIVL